MGSRKTVPPRMLRIVPFGDFHICFNLNSSTRASSGVIVALKKLIPIDEYKLTLANYFLFFIPFNSDVILLDGICTVDSDLIVRFISVLDSKVERLKKNKSHAKTDDD